MIEYKQIQAAQLALGQVAVSGGDLVRWRTQQGISDEDLERAALESANDTLEEIESLLDEDSEVGPAQLREFLIREFMTAFQVAWICRGRAERAVDTEAS